MPLGSRHDLPLVPLIFALCLGWAAPACWIAVHEDDEVDSYDLEGAHTDLSCSDCHGDDFALISPSRNCTDCHGDDSPEGHLGGGCKECHNQDTWDEPDWEHEDYPLKGGHAGVPCIDCHEDGDEDAPDDCEDCHADDAPPFHPDDDCDNCHSIWGW